MKDDYIKPGPHGAPPEHGTREYADAVEHDVDTAVVMILGMVLIMAATIALAIIRGAD